MDVLDAQAVADAFPLDGAGGAVLGPIFNSAGGYYNVETNPVYVQYGYGAYGEVQWTPAVPIPVGPAILAPGTVAVRFRNYVAGNAAVVSGALSERGEPVVQITSGGIASAGSSGLTVISDQVLGGPAASIDFSAIPSTFRALQLIAQLRSTAGAIATDRLFLTVNADGGANYAEQALRFNNGVSSDDKGVGETSFQQWFIPAGLAPAGAAGELVAYFANYAGTSLRKTMRAEYGYSQADAATNDYVGMLFGTWRNTAAINRLTLTLSAGPTFAAGSRATLFGL